MSAIEVRELKKDEYKMWDELAENSPQGMIFHSSDWLKIVEKHTNSKLYLFAGYLGNEIIAAIPFFYHRRFFLKTLSSPVGSAMIQNLGPIIPNYDDLKQDKREFYFREFQTLTSNHFREHIQSKCLIQIHHLLWNLSDHATPTHLKMVDLAVFE